MEVGEAPVATGIGMVIAAVVAGAIFSGVTSTREISPGVTVNGVKGAGPMAKTAIAGALRSVLTTSAAPMTAGPEDGVEPPVVVEAVRREAVPGVGVLVVIAPVDPVPARVAVAPPVAGGAAGAGSAARRTPTPPKCLRIAQQL